MPRPAPFRPALLLIDIQEDFCPPSGSLAVPHARSIAPVVNTLLAPPHKWALTLATRDCHPPDHISFAANHAPPHNTAFTSFATIANPLNADEPAYESRLWPVHCVQGTPGAEIIQEISLEAVERIVEKGMDPRVEMYSAFDAPFRAPRVSESDVKKVLLERQVTHVYLVGLATDYCVLATAKDAVDEGWQGNVYVFKEGVRGVGDGEDGSWGKGVQEDYDRAGVKVIGLDSEEGSWLREN